ncbi:MAG TPA: hypothetical protein DET40_23310 [Lentisphaeria bacterium]|nr:MAG: hypothetical protein A2X45_24615 [Lentisphaerae bacterium GWF2_50_93]HCE46484.1 hypothetical protein [Lentisphaeria bacterium]
MSEHEIINTAIVPVPNTQKDFYDWNERRSQKVAEAKKGSHDLIFIGDSITHMFEMEGRGAAIWQRYYGQRSAFDLGYGWDCTQNVLWRLENGEFAGQHPKLVVLNIGTNNLTGNSTARANSAAEIFAGIEAICQFIHRHSPESMILVMSIFPRGLSNDPVHAKVKELNAVLKSGLECKPGIIHLDIGQRFIGSDGEIPLELMNDRCHPAEKGYKIWADAIEQVVTRYL